MSIQVNRTSPITDVTIVKSKSGSPMLRVNPITGNDKHQFDITMLTSDGVATVKGTTLREFVTAADELLTQQGY